MLRPQVANVSQPFGNYHDGTHQPVEDETSSLFAEVVNVQVKLAGRDEFTAALTVRLQPDNVAHPRNLLLELTDEADLLFYHSLVLGEGDFHALKAEQRLRVDFQSFPAQLVELFRRCMSEGGGSSASGSSGSGVGASGTTTGGLRMLAHLECASSGDSVLSIVESNQFRELTHISLRLRQGSDEAVKQHLAGKLKSIRAEAADLAGKYKECQDQLERTRRQADELTARARVVSEERQHLERSLEGAHQREVSELRQEHSRAIAELQRTLTDEKMRIEAELRQNVASASARATAAERLNEDLQHRQQTLTSSSRSCQERLENTELQLRDAGQETQGLREQVKQLELLKYQHEREIGELRVQVSGLREQLNAKELLVSNQASQIEQAGVQRRTLEEAVAACKQQIHELEDKFAMSASEIAKGNQIIQNLHATSKQAKAKLKQKTSEVVRQEKVVLEFERAEELHKHVLEEKENEIARGREAETRLRKEMEELKKKLAEAHEVLKTNQDVIEYLNRQLTERDLKGLTSTSTTAGAMTNRFAEALGTSPVRDADLFRRADGGRGTPNVGVAGFGGTGSLGGVSGFASPSLSSAFGGLTSGAYGGLGAARAAAYGGLFGATTTAGATLEGAADGIAKLATSPSTGPSAATADPSMSAAIARSAGLSTCSAAQAAVMAATNTDALLRGPVAYRTPDKAGALPLRNQIAT